MGIELGDESKTYFAVDDTVSGGEVEQNPEDLQNIGRTINQEYDEYREYLHEHRDDNSATEKAKQGYLEKIKSIYNTFTEKYGPVKGKTLSDYTESYVHLMQFLKEIKCNGYVAYDLGFRWQIDMLLDDDTLEPWVKDECSKVMEKIGLHTCPKDQTQYNTEIRDDLESKYSKEELKNLCQSFGYLDAKCSFGYSFSLIVGSLDKQFIMTKQDVNQELVDKKLSEFPENIQKYWEMMDTGYSDAAGNSNLGVHNFRPLVTALNNRNELGLENTNQFTQEKFREKIDDEFGVNITLAPEFYEMMKKYEK